MQLKTLELYTADLQAQVLFYRDLLGCVVSLQKGAFTIHTQCTQLIFRQAAAGAPVYHFAFTIPGNRVEEALKWTAARVPLLEVAPGQQLADFKNWDAQAFYFLDPAGNVVEFISRRPLGIISQSSFSGSSLASVSEIGLVTDDVALACRQLEELWDVSIFSKQAPTPHFAAAGDDHGLFIVVTENRPWFPTKIKAAKAPLAAVFQSSDGLLRTLDIF